MQPRLLAAGLASLTACAPPRAELAPDPHSFAEPSRVRVTHVKLDLALDFGLRVVRGQVILLFERPDPEAPLVLDTQALEIASVTGPDGRRRDWALGEQQGRLGRPLTIQLAPGDDEVAIGYATTAAGEALQFLAPEQTAGEHPFLFTQGQSIRTRSWIPLQDTPGVRATYDATVVAPRPLTVLMSAGTRNGPGEMVGDAGVGLWRFRMDHPIPSYLIALACGELESRPISERCAVWAEPSVADAAAHEFADVERMVVAAEELFGPYRWGRYDVLVLPPAFPYGGMENPTLTFMTPTVLAGDRSLVSILAHELAHSWSGNLVTNATWGDFWLNEGFTVYCERRIMEALYGEERADMEALLAWNALDEDLQRLEPWQTVLHIDLQGRHPDEGSSWVPYEKGALLLTRIEELFGREAFDRALGAWFDEHAFSSRSTGNWVAFFERVLFSDYDAVIRQLELETWLDEPGLPVSARKPRSVALHAVELELARLGGGAAPADLATQGWVTQQWLHFLDELPDDLTARQMGFLDAAFELTGSTNSELTAAWLELGIRHGYGAIDARLEDFLMTVGRTKFLKPLYEELVRTEAGRARAREIYAAARPRYHAVSALTLDAVVHGE